MIQEQKQRQKWITFEELCPIWSEAIRTNIVSGRMGSGYSHCIVGEAYHNYESINNTIYYWEEDKEEYCDLCTAFAYVLVNGEKSEPDEEDKFGIDFTDRKITINNEAYFEKMKHHFMVHWNEKHVDIGARNVKS